MTLALTACASCGKPVDPDELRAFTIGKTTQADVRALLGAAGEASTAPDGITTVVYNFTDEEAQWENFVPILGGVAGGMDKTVQKDTFVFDQDGKLKSYAQVSSLNGVDTSPLPSPPFP